MEEMMLQQPELIGREAELNKLKQSLDNAISGKGSTTFIAGEAGIGKTRLVSELIKEAEAKDVQLIQGWCLAESLEPLMPIKTALREAGLFHLISGDPPPLVVSAYLMDDSGILIAKSEREELDLDAHIFSSMLKAVGSFVKDSMQMVDEEKIAGGLNILGYQEYKILIEEYQGLHLASVTKGSLSEFLVSDMRSVLNEVNRTYGDVLADWDGDLDKVKGIDNIVSRMVMSGKYGGQYIIDDPNIRQENLFDNVLLGIQRLSSEKPLLLFLDDLQWVDPSTLNLLHYLARNTKQSMVMIMGTYRPEDIVKSWEGKTHQLETAMQNMNRENLLEKIQLERLSPDSTRGLVESTLGAISFEQVFFNKIYNETEGNPFFILEVIKLLSEENALAQDEEDTWILAADIEKLDIPSKVYDVVKRRLNRLIEEQREMLECASVIGEEFSTDILEQTTDMGKLPLLKNLSKIEKTHMLIHYLKDKYRFDHAKVREVLYNGISEELRKEFHRIVGDTIAEIHKDNLDEVTGELAYHYYEAGDEKASEYLIKVGSNAWADMSVEEARRAYSKALEISKDPCSRIEALLGLIWIHNFYGEYDLSNTEIIEASEYIVNCQEKKLEARLLQAKGLLRREQGEIDESNTLTEKTLNISLEIDDKEGIASAYTTLASNAYYSGDYETSLEFLEKSLKIEEEIGNKRQIASKYRYMAEISKTRANYDVALGYFEKSRQICEEIGNRRIITDILAGMTDIARIKGDREEELRLYENVLQIFNEMGKEHDLGNIYHTKALIAKLKGNYQESIEYYHKCQQMCEESGDKWGISRFHEKISKIYVEKGEYDKALECAKESLEIRENMGFKRGMAYTLNYIGSVHQEKGELDKALEYYGKSLEIGLEIGEKMLSVNNYCGLVEAHLGLEDVLKALENAEKAVEISKNNNLKSEEAISHRVLGMVFREKFEWNKAIESFENARVILEDTGEKKEMARLFHEYGLLWKAKSEHDKAKEHLEKSLSMFEEMGMKLWAEKCEKALEKIEN